MSSDKENLIFKALAHPKRRKILDLLRSNSLTTGEICEHFKDLDRCTVMQHLGKLEKAELIIVKRSGRMRHNYLNASPIQRIYNRWIKDYAAPAANFLEKVSSSLED